MRAWKQALDQAGIVTLFLLSNSRKPGRAQRFAEALGIPLRGPCGQAQGGGLFSGRWRMGAAPEETAIVGDQIFYGYLGGQPGRCADAAGPPHPVWHRVSRPALRFGGAFRAGPERVGAVRRGLAPPANPEGFYAAEKTVKQMPGWLRERGLDAYEYQCGKGVTVGEATARAIGQAAAQAGIALSLHAPYFVNPANPEPDSQAKTAGYVLAACRVARWMGADRVVVHTGAIQKRTRQAALWPPRGSAS